MDSLLESVLYALSKWHLFATGAIVTVELTVISMILGSLIGLLVALLKISHFKFLVVIGSFYTWVFRGMPLLVQIFIIYYGLPRFGIDFGPFISAVVALSLCSGAYIAEFIRAAILSIDKGQMEAALSLGMSHWKAMQRIIIPQTYRRLVPPLASEFITLLKDTSMVSVMAMTEILRTAQVISAASLRNFEMYMMAGVVYLMLTTVATVLSDRLEKKLALKE